MTYATQNIKVGDRVCYAGYSDVYPATVIVRTAKTLIVRTDDGKLLNAPNSGEPDALKMDIGGFAAHTSGTQRWDIFEDPHGSKVKFTWREKAGKWVQVGSNPRQQGGKLMNGWHKFYDYNF